MNKEQENKICEFIKMCMELRRLVKFENQMMLQSAWYQNKDLSTRKLSLLKRFSEDSPEIMSLNKKGNDMSTFLHKMLIDVMGDLKYHLNINTSYQMNLMKVCLGDASHIESIRSSLDRKVGLSDGRHERCH